MAGQELIQELQRRGVVIHAPEATVVEDVDPERFEPGAEIFPGCTIRGQRTMVGRQSRLGRAGGGYFENVCVGRGADLYGGFFQDAVFLDGVIVRGHAEMRRGTLMEEGSEAAHHVGYKMTITLPFVVTGSLVNFCDALVAGGTGRQDHTEIGSSLALYNFTPRGDKFASLFGDVPRGVFLRSPRIFVGGQAQIVSPVKVGFGAVIAAGAAVRRSVPGSVLYREPVAPVQAPFDPLLYPALAPKFRLTAEFITNLWALHHFYEHVRIPSAGADAFLQTLYREAQTQIRAGVVERIKRLDRIVALLPESSARHRARAASLGSVKGARQQVEWHRGCCADHDRVLGQWPGQQPLLANPPETALDEDLLAIGNVFREVRHLEPRPSYVQVIQQHLRDDLVEKGQTRLGIMVERLLAHAGF